jgi:hypothetical protein
MIFAHSAYAVAYNITIVNSGGTAEGAGWSVTSGVLTSSSNLNINASDISSKMAAGELTIEAADLTVNDSITATSGYKLTLKATGKIVVRSSVKIATGGGDINFHSDSDANLSGPIRLGGSNSAADYAFGKIESGGGSITFSGGSNLASGYSYASTDYGVVAASGAKPKAGVSIFGFTINAAGGDIVIRGHGGTQTASTRAVLIESSPAGQSSLSTSGTGKIEVIGNGSSIAGNNPWGPTFSNVSFSTASGIISVTGVGNTSSSYTNSRGIVTSTVNFTSSSGNITLTDQTDGTASNYRGTYFGGTNTFNTAGNVTISADEIESAAGAKLTLTSNVGIIQPYTSASFTATPAFDEIDASNSQALTVGATGNTSGLTFSSPINSGGILNLYGGSIALNSVVTASTNFNIAASGNVTQTGRVTSSGLKLSGSGNFTLDSTSNAIGTLAAGTTGSRVGSVSLTNSAALTIGTVSGIAGIYSSETITVATITGNLDITQPISTSGTANDRVVMYANRGQSSGNAGSGNITVSGIGAIDIQSGARALLYSGTRTDSSGLVAAVGGESNSRSLIDSSTVLSSISPTLGATGAFALFRTDTPASSGSSSSSGQSCSYPIISGLSSNRGVSTGGYTITINGSNLSSPIYLGGRPVQVLALSFSTALITIPAGNKGKTSIQVSGCSNSAQIDFYYDPEPVISKLSSSYVSTNGGKLEITGEFLSESSIISDDRSFKVEIRNDSVLKLDFSKTVAGERKYILKNPFGSREFSLTFIDPPSILAESQPVYIAKGDSTSFAFSARYASNYSYIGNFPTGLILDNSNGRVTGTAKQEGEFTFILRVSNEVDSQEKKFTLMVDKPTPKPISTNLYFGYKNSSMNSFNEKTLDRFIAKVKAVAPSYLQPTLTIIGQSGSNAEKEDAVIKNQINNYFENSGIKLLKSASSPGKNNKLNLIVSWPRG